MEMRSRDYLWVEKYRPRRVSEVIGNEQAKSAFVEWLAGGKRRKKAVLFHGPAGWERHLSSAPLQLRWVSG